MASVRFRPDPAKSGGYMVEAVDNEGVIAASVGPVPADARVQRQYDEPGSDMRMDEAMKHEDHGAVPIAGDFEFELLSIDRLYTLLRDELTRFGGDVQLIERDQGYLRVMLYTEFKSYNIRARSSAGHTYLGCEGKQRRARPGEKELRGRDLADGDLSYHTLHRIFRDIVAYELAPIEYKGDSGIVTL